MPENPRGSPGRSHIPPLAPDGRVDYAKNYKPSCAETRSLKCPISFRVNCPLLSVGGMFSVSFSPGLLILWDIRLVQHTSCRSVAGGDGG